MKIYFVMCFNVNGENVAGNVWQETEEVVYVLGGFGDVWWDAKGGD